MVSDVQRGNGGAPGPTAPSGPQLEPSRPAKRRGSPNPVAVIAGALVAGYVLAKAIHWRGDAHPRG
jgi:hypothetical protein